MRSKILELAAAVASAIDELGIIGSRPVVSLVPQYDTQSESDLKCVIVPGLYALQRIARDGAKENRRRRRRLVQERERSRRRR